MKNEYSDTMKKVSGNKKWLFQRIVLLVLICSFISFGIFSLLSSKAQVAAEMENAEIFDPGVTTAISDVFSNNLPGRMAYKYSRLTMQFLSEPFASNFDDTINFCIAGDTNFYPYIVAVRAAEMDQYQDLIEYSYSDSTKAPETITMKGVPEEIDDELGDLTASALNTFYGEKFTDTDSFSEVTGILYLNTTITPEPDYKAFVICLLITAVLLVIYVKIRIPQKRYRKYQKDTLGKFDSSALIDVERELEQHTTISLNKENLYITANYLVSRLPFLQIIPIHDVVHLYGLSGPSSGKDQGVVAVTGDGVKHEMSFIPSQNADNNLTAQIVQKMKSAMPDIKYGFESGFYTDNTPDLYEEYAPDGKSVVFLGIIGAVIGAALGSVVWIIIGKIGFIAGIAGLIMVIAAMKGYSILAGTIDRKGRIISICIAMAMILAANYSSYAIEYCIANDSLNPEGLIDAYKMLPALMTKANLWSSFAIDLILGYALSIWSCVSLTSRRFFG